MSRELKDPLGVEEPKKKVRIVSLDSEGNIVGGGGGGNSSITTTLDPWSQIAIMMISALSFISAFAWNGTMTAFLDQKFGQTRGFNVHLIYAVLVTVLSALAIYYIVKYTDVWISKQQQEEGGIVTG